MRIRPLDVHRHKTSMFEQMREGWDYVRTFRPIRTILLLFSLVSLMGYSWTVLLPIFAGQVLHGGATTLGWLTGASGVGALGSALSLAVRKSVVGLTGMLQIAVAMLGGALILFGFSHVSWLSLLLMAIIGFGMIQAASVSNTIIQTLVPEDKRARAMSYYTMAFFGAAPFGSLLAGMLADHIGAPHTVIITGAFCIAGSFWFTLELPKIRAIIRPIYHEMGLLPVPDINLSSDTLEPAKQLYEPNRKENHDELVPLHRLFLCRNVSHEFRAAFRARRLRRSFPVTIRQPSRKRIVLANGERFMGIA
jgi:MFS family permease